MWTIIIGRATQNNFFAKGGKLVIHFNPQLLKLFISGRDRAQIMGIKAQISINECRKFGLEF